jgi:hypothetical protein
MQASTNSDRSWTRPVFLSVLTGLAAASSFWLVLAAQANPTHLQDESRPGQDAGSVHQQVKKFATDAYRAMAGKHWQQ